VPKCLSVISPSTEQMSGLCSFMTFTSVYILHKCPGNIKLITLKLEASYVKTKIQVKHGSVIMIKLH
jgi:hypothetical protein